MTRYDEARYDETRYEVVVNDAGQYSVWDTGSEPPEGWRRTGFSGTRAECLAHIDEVWTGVDT